MSSLLLLKSILIANARQNKSAAAKNTNKLKKQNKKRNIKGPKCRICDKENGDVPIFDNLLQPDIPDQILNFTGVSILESDGLSKHMCDSCLELLNGCIKFKEMCQKTNKKLIEKSIKKEPKVSVEINITKDYSDSCDELKIDEYNDDDEFEHYIDDNSDYMQDNFYLSSLKDNKVDKDQNKAKNIEKTSGQKKKFLCDVCGKTLHSNASLVAHLLIHEPIFPFKCDKCPYRGRTSDLLKVHQRTHMQEKPFKCPQCAKTSTTASNLAKHVRHVHSTNKPFKCTYCDKAFSYQHDVKRHVKDIHLRQGTAQCYICYKKFNTRKILRGHQWKVHKIKGERTGRLPAYLKYQMGMTGTENINHNITEVPPETEYNIT